MRTIEIPETLTMTYDVDKCAHPKFNGSHTETFDISVLTSDDIVQYLAQTLTIKRQTQLRSKGAVDTEKGENKITLGTWKVPAPGKRVSVSPVEKVTNMLNKLTLEQKQAIAKAMGFDFIPAGLPEPDAMLEKGEES